MSISTVAMKNEICLHEFKRKIWVKLLQSVLKNSGWNLFFYRKSQFREITILTFFVKKKKKKKNCKIEVRSVLLY